MVTYAWQVLHATAADEDHGVLLERVALARDVGGDFHLVGQTDTRDLAKGRVRLLRRHREHARAGAARLRAGLERGRLRLGSHFLTAVPEQLVNRRQNRTLR